MKNLIISVAVMLSSLVSIGQTITVNSPSGGDTLIGAQTYNISWTTTGIIDSVDIYYRRGALRFIERVVNTGSYSWTLPGSIISSNFGYVRVKNAVSPLYDENDVAFRFQEASKSFTMVYPNALTDTIYAGQANTIQWNWTGNMSKVHLYYSKNGGVSFTRFSPYNGITNSGSYVWFPSNSLSSSQLIIKVEGYSFNSTYSDVSDTTSILKIGKTLSLLSPLPKNLVSGNSENITWTSTSSIAYVDIEYSKDYGPWISIVDSTINDGHYNWTVPMDSSNTVRMRIVDNASSSVHHTVYGYTMSTSPQTLTIVYPNGGESFTEGDSVLVSWNHSANLNGVNLELHYSTDSGTTWTFIQDFLTTGSYDWIVPYHVSSSNCLVKILVNGTPSIYDISDAVFTIALGPPSLTITNPNGGQKYLAGSNGSMNFISTGSLDTLNLYYSANNGISWNLHQTGISSTTSFASINWSDIQSDSCLLRLEDSGNVLISDDSDNPFSIRKFKLSQPWPNTTAYAGTTTNIRWTKSMTTHTTVSLYYSNNDGTSWSLIDSSVSNTGSYVWQVPNDSTINGRIRVEDDLNAQLFDESSGSFNILPSPIQITFPNGGEYLDKSVQNTITWTTSNPSIAYVRIKYSLNGGLTWLAISNYYSNTGSYTWSTPNIVSSNVLIRVENYYGGGNPYDVSDASFNVGLIAPNAITVISPNGGEVYSLGTMQDILWSSTGVVDTVDILFSSNSGTTWTNLALNELNDGIYTATMPSVISPNCLIKILKTGHDSIVDSSNAVFSIIQPPTITLITPNGGEVLAEGSVFNVNWDTSSVTSSLSLYYTTNNGSSWSIIDSNLLNTGIYAWSIPTGIASTNCKIRIVGDVLNSASSDKSDAVFSIVVPPGTVTLTSPNGGEMWQQQTSQAITWVSSGIVNAVDLYYSKDGGTNWLAIALNTNNDSLHNWNIPFIVEPNVLVKIEVNGSSFINDISDSSFQIIEEPHNVTLTTPSFPILFWTEGQTKQIKWRTDGIIPFVNIYVSNDNGLSYNLIADSVINNMTALNSFSWLVPHGLNSYNCRIKVEELGDPTIFAANRVEISDIRSLTIVSPNGGEVFNGQDTIDIRWTETGLIHTIQMAYSLDSGVTWNNIKVVQFYDTNTVVSFVAPNTFTDRAIVRASEAQSGFTSGQSDSSFTINPIAKSISIINPPDTIGIYGTYGFDWTSTGVTNFDVYQSIDSGMTWQIAQGNQFGVNHFNWQGPGINTSAAMLRIEDRDSSLIYDTTQVFTVVGYSELAVNYPNGGEYFISDSSYVISWSHLVGSINPLTFIDISYSIDSGITWLSVAQNVNAITDSTYNWHVPSMINSQACLIKIEDINHGINHDLSNNYFTIEVYKSLKVLSPDSIDVLYSDSSNQISWATGGIIPNVNLFYKIDSAQTWNLIDSNVVNTGVYNWNIPMGINAYSSIRVQATVLDTIQDTSRSVVITPKVSTLNMVFPNGGEIFIGGKHETAIWDWTGVYTTQWELRLSIDSGQTWFNVNDGQAFSGLQDSSTWNVPNVNSNNCLMVISSFPYSDTSDAFFSINFNPTTIAVSSPNGAENLLGNTNTKITWDTTSNSHIDSVEISFKGSFGFQNSFITVANTGVYNWEIPNINTTTAQIRVKLQGYTFFDDSDANFAISQTVGDTLVVISPNGGENLVAGQQVPILWIASTNIPLVDIEFSQDNGATWTAIASNTINCGYYLWTVPTLSSTNCLVRVSGNTKLLIQDVSDGSFGVQIVTSLSEIENKSIQLYPNPISNNQVLNVTGLNNMQIEMYDLSGKMVLARNTIFRIELKGFSSGVYLIHIISDNKRMIEKLIVK